MSDLEEALDRFKEAMLSKFEARAVKRGADSVTLDGNLDKLDIRQVAGHFIEEIGERLCAGSWEEAAKEDIDVANLAFLDWYLRTRTLKSLLAGEDIEQVISR